MISGKEAITEVFERSLITVVVGQEYFRLQSANAVKRIMSCCGNFALLIFMYLTDSENYFEVTRTALELKFAVVVVKSHLQGSTITMRS